MPKTLTAKTAYMTPLGVQSPMPKLATLHGTKESNDAIKRIQYIVLLMGVFRCLYTYDLLCSMKYAKGIKFHYHLMYANQVAETYEVLTLFSFNPG